MYAVSAAFLTAIRGSHAVKSRVDAYRAGTLIAADIPVVGGTVAITSATGVRRTFTGTLTGPALEPFGSGAVSPYGVELHVFRGVVFPNGTEEMVPLGVFMVETMKTKDGEPLETTSPDRAKALVDDQFLLPVQSGTGVTVINQITTLISEVYTGATLTNVDVDTGVLVPPVVWDRDRWAAIDELALAQGAEVFYDQVGQAVIRKQTAIDAATSWVTDIGQHGVVITATRTIDRTSAYNAVVATGERSDGAPPVYGVAYDTDVTSATYWSGPFGHRPFFFNSPLITTTGGATAVAATLLNRKRSLGREVSLSGVVNPALDVGDVIVATFPDGTTERHIVDTLSIPLDAGRPMDLTTRTPEPFLVIVDAPITIDPGPPDGTVLYPDDGGITPIGFGDPFLDDTFPIDPLPSDGMPGDGISGEPIPPGDDLPPPPPPSDGLVYSASSHRVSGVPWWEPNVFAGGLVSWPHYLGIVPAGLTYAPAGKRAYHQVVGLAPGFGGWTAFDVQALHDDSGIWEVVLSVPAGTDETNYVWYTDDTWVPTQMRAVPHGSGEPPATIYATCYVPTSSEAGTGWTHSWFDYTSDGSEWVSVCMGAPTCVGVLSADYGYREGYTGWQVPMWAPSLPTSSLNGTWRALMADGWDIVLHGSFTSAGSTVVVAVPPGSSDYPRALQFGEDVRDEFGAFLRTDIHTSYGAIDPTITPGPPDEPIPSPPGEQFTLHFLPQALPEVVVRLDGVVVDSSMSKYDLDYVTGIFTIMPAMGATIGQVVGVLYWSDGTVSP